jgi:hypothetical protein
MAKLLHPKHNEIVDRFINLFDPEKDNIIKKLTITTILTLYGIKISYNKNLILSLAVSLKHYRGVRICLLLGASPHDILDSDTVMELDIIDKLRVDGIFRSYGYICEWQYFGGIIDFHNIILNQ